VSAAVAVRFKSRSVLVVDRRAPTEVDASKWANLVLKGEELPQSLGQGNGHGIQGANEPAKHQSDKELNSQFICGLRASKCLYIAK
jgi:hypothetical protein